MREVVLMTVDECQEQQVLEGVVGRVGPVSPGDITPRVSPAHRGEVGPWAG